MSITLEDLGVTKEKLLELVVEKLTDSVMLDDEGYESKLFEEFNKKVRQSIDQSIAALAEKSVLPNVAEYVEKITLQATNEWGEKKGEPKSFIEYLIWRAEVYLSEKVDHNGKGKNEGDYSWSGRQTRICYLVHHHLQYAIENAMKKALENANASIIGGINEAVRMKLDEVAAKFKVQVSTGR